MLKPNQVAAFKRAAVKQNEGWEKAENLRDNWSANAADKRFVAAFDARQKKMDEWEEEASQDQLVELSDWASGLNMMWLSDCLNDSMKF